MEKYAFISYVREDESDVLQICDFLKRNDIKYWVDKEQLFPGDYWATSIMNAIKDGAYFLACFSINSNKKEKTYMREEIRTAIETARLLSLNRKWIIPIRLSECDIPDYPLGPGKSLKDIQYVDYFKDREEALLKILYAIYESESIPKEANDRLQNSNLMVGGVMHDTRNYLAGIHGYLTLIKHNKDSVKIDEYINKMEEALIRMEKMLSNTLDYIRDNK
jgi:hypothetical protein